MKTADDQNLQRYLDDELDAEARAAFQASLSGNEALRRELDGCRAIGELLRAEYAPERPLPHGDFFHAQLLRRITDESSAPVRRWRLPSFLSWLNHPMGAALAGAAACAAVLLPFLLNKEGGLHGPDQLASIVRQSAYVPMDNGSAEGFYHEDASAMVVVINGLPELPGDSQIGGFRFSVPDELRGKLPGTGSREVPATPVAGRGAPAPYHPVAFLLPDAASRP